MPANLATTDLPCPLWRRLLALVYDLLIVAAIVMVVGLLCQMATGGHLIGTGAKVTVPLWYQALQGVVVAAYFISSWRRGGRTGAASSTGRSAPRSSRHSRPRRSSTAPEPCP